MIELPMSLIEYDALLVAVQTAVLPMGVGAVYGYGSVTACVLADRFDELNMPLHAARFRSTGSTSHPFFAGTGIGGREDLIAVVHLMVTAPWPCHAGLSDYLLRNHGCVASGTLDNVILEASK